MLKASTLFGDDEDARAKETSRKDEKFGVNGVNGVQQEVNH